MNKKVSLVQMEVEFGNSEANFERLNNLLLESMKDNPDIICLPETWNTGFFPTDRLETLSDNDGKKTRKFLGNFAKEHNVNIVGGSVANNKNGGIYNTCYVFDRLGNTIAEYDKIHGFSPAKETEFFKGGKDIVTFELDGIKCGVIICYDVRFLELVRSLALEDIKLLFVPAQWPSIRIEHWKILNRARAIENQFFVACVNGCGSAGATKYGGNSMLIDPWGEVLLNAGDEENVVSGLLDLEVIEDIRERINIFRDRKPELYKIK
ncbi:MAG: carbon-nitrogen family hydrolase [Clostridium sp.]